jgi:hypothetical protein
MNSNVPTDSGRVSFIQMRTQAMQKPKRNSKKCRAPMKCFQTPRRKRDTTSLVKQVSVDRVVVAPEHHQVLQMKHRLDKELMGKDIPAA